jgi:hypothetical protein
VADALVPEFVLDVTTLDTDPRTLPRANGAAPVVLVAGDAAVEPNIVILLDTKHGVLLGVVAFPDGMPGVGVVVVVGRLMIRRR